MKGFVVLDFYEIRGGEVVFECNTVAEAMEFCKKYDEECYGECRLRIVQYA